MVMEEARRVIGADRVVVSRCFVMSFQLFFFEFVGFMCALFSE